MIYSKIPKELENLNDILLKMTARIWALQSDSVYIKYNSILYISHSIQIGRLYKSVNLIRTEINTLNEILDKRSKIEIKREIQSLYETI